jgi:DeoR/GlpR family transcriptional regulator of sugar metabolism
MDRFFVKAGSVNAVRKALDRAPGGARVIGRFDRETIECIHTMDAHSLGRHWPVLLSRLEKAGLVVVDRPRSGGSSADAVSQTDE